MNEYLNHQKYLASSVQSFISYVSPCTLPSNSKGQSTTNQRCPSKPCYHILTSLILHLSTNCFTKDAHPVRFAVLQALSRTAMDRNVLYSRAHADASINMF